MSSRSSSEVLITSSSRITDGPTNINYHPSTRLPAAGDIAEEVKAKKKTQKKKPKPSKKMTIADWYGLSEDLQHVFKTSPSTGESPRIFGSQHQFLFLVESVAHSYLEAFDIGMQSRHSLSQYYHR